MQLIINIVDYVTSKGNQIVLPVNETVNNVLALFGLTPQNRMVKMNGKVLKANDFIEQSPTGFHVMEFFEGSTEVNDAIETVTNTVGTVTVSNKIIKTLAKAIADLHPNSPGCTSEEHVKELFEEYNSIRLIKVNRETGEATYGTEVIQEFNDIFDKSDESVFFAESSQYIIHTRFVQNSRSGPEEGTIFISNVLENGILTYACQLYGEYTNYTYTPFVNN